MTKIITSKIGQTLMISLVMLGFSPTPLLAQHRLQADIQVIYEEGGFEVNQLLTYKNTSSDTLEAIYLSDWNNAFSKKTSPLGERFADNYNRRFRFSSLEERGFTEIQFIRNKTGKLDFKRLPEHLDIIKVPLSKPLLPGQKTKIHLNYILNFPVDDFTGYGYENGNFRLRYHVIVPAVYHHGWHYYSHKNMNGQFVPLMKVQLDIKIPYGYQLISAMESKIIKRGKTQKTIRLSGDDSFKNELFILKRSGFLHYPFENITVITNINDPDLSLPSKRLKLNKILGFLSENLGPYPDSILLASRENYFSNPVYGLNQLPEIIRPFSDAFQYEIRMMKVISQVYLKNSLQLNPRKEAWLLNAFQIFLMMRYVQKYHPNIKLLGKLSDFFAVEWLHAAELPFNFRYPFFYLNMARLNLDQPLNMSQDSLIKFNQRIANPFKAGVGLAYLDDYLGGNTVEKSIKKFFVHYRLKPAEPSDFISLLKFKAEKPVAWFYEDYVSSNTHIDFEIEGVQEKRDSLWVYLHNKENNRMPVSLYGITDWQIVFKTWTPPFRGDTLVKIPKINAERLALNYERIIPEYNQRDNYYGLNTFLDKPIQIRLFQDIQDPRYHQLFVMPEFSYNLYDGVAIGPKIYNGTVLRKNFSFDLAPKYAFKSETIVGSASVSYTHYFQNQGFDALSYGVSGTRYSYAQGLFYQRYAPFITFSFRDMDLRQNEDQYINIRNVTVDRERNEDKLVDEPNYSVWAFSYGYSDQNLVNYFTANFSLELADKFSKISVSSKYRKLFLNNRQIEIRFFGGIFLNNNTGRSNYFSFALDRPTDYLFDYNYYGRSESDGLFSQQYIEAEGGFKSKLQPAFANQWLTTLNSSITIWNWIYAYGDVGLVKNEGVPAQFLYDSGIRVSLVQDYFELYFPVYSSLGWEIAQPDYTEKIRFIVSLDFNTLIGLFTREWY